MRWTGREQNQNLQVNNLWSRKYVNDVCFKRKWNWTCLQKKLLLLWPFPWEQFRLIYIYNNILLYLQTTTTCVRQYLYMCKCSQCEECKVKIVLFSHEAGTMKFTWKMTSAINRIDYWTIGSSCMNCLTSCFMHFLYVLCAKILICKITKAVR